MAQSSKSNPYSSLPTHCFWRTGVAESSPSRLDGIYKKKWDIEPSCRIATAGSCFAQHIHKAFAKFGMNVLNTEPAPFGLPSDVQSDFGYSLFSARYGNIYTTSQLKQLCEEALHLSDQRNIIWEKNGRFSMRCGLGSSQKVSTPLNS